jgi:hypothetical protein
MRLRDCLRVSAVALLGLLMCSLTPAEAARRGDHGPAAHRSAPARSLATPAGRPSAAQHRPARAAHAATPRRGAAHASRGHRVQQAAPLRGRLATSRDSRAAYTTSACHRDRHGRCRGTMRASMGGWAHGLPPAANVQANECPDGTMATLARGHDSIVRCMPL